MYIKLETSLLPFSEYWQYGDQGTHRDRVNILKRLVNYPIVIELSQLESRSGSSFLTWTISYWL